MKQDRKDPLSLIEDEYRKNYSFLKYFLIKLTSDEKLAEDIIQEVFFKLLIKPEQVLKFESIRSWLITCAKNTLIDLYRKKKPSLLKDEEIIINMLIDNHGPEEKFLMRNEVNEILERLSEMDKTIFLAKEHYGYKYDEIAALLNMPVSSVKSRMFRLRKDILSSVQRSDYDGK
ncbi:RNA polymerase sigma factor [Bacillus fonticola]|uniref:RNA polymerase sigma factor n=1 Tax=Bacillus fonticola TaxID=2728853 RepID=UPI00147349B6|nr:RNA polymerase sigma factor [Bacillus fonticola]